MSVLLDGIADIERLACLDVVIESGHAKGDAIHDALAAVIDHFKLDVLIVASNEFACPEVQHIACDEDWLVILRTEGIELFHAPQEVAVDIFEHEFAVDVHRWRHLFVMDMLLDIFGQPSTKFADVLDLHRQAYCISVPAEIF